MKKIILLLSLVFIGISAVLFFLFKPVSHFSYIAFFIGKVEIMKTDNSVEPAEIKYVLKEDDVVKTGNNSKAYIQFGADSLLEVNSNTELKMNKLPGRLESSFAKTQVDLTDGKIIITVSKIKGDGGFIVRYRTQTIAVRGTIFSVEGSGNTLSVIVREGVVNVRDDNNTFKDFNLQEGRKAEISGKDVKITETVKSDNDIFIPVSNLMPITCMDCTPPEYVEKYYRWMLYRENGNLNKDEFRDTIDKSNESTSSVRLNINLLKTEGVDSKTASDITKTIYNRLSGLKGSDKVIYRSLTKSGGNANRQLSGRISRIGDSYAISLNVTDAETGGILFSNTKVTKKDEISNVLYTLTEIISNTAGIWNK